MFGRPAGNAAGLVYNCDGHSRHISFLAVLSVTSDRVKMSYSYVSQPGFLVFYISVCDWPSVHRIPFEQAYVYIPMIIGADITLLENV
jgi:hypothetical protein